MAINWKLKTYLAKEHSIYKLVDLQKKITKSTGVIISTQNLANMMNHKPKQIRLETARTELDQASEFDYSVVNDEVARCAQEVVDLVQTT
jgi:guanylate kinase